MRHLKILMLACIGLLLTFAAYPQKKSVNTPKIVINTCSKDNNQASFDVDILMKYNIGCPNKPTDDPRDIQYFWDNQMITAWFSIHSISQSINYNGRNIPMSSIKGMEDKSLRIDIVYADVYSGNEKINNIKLPFDNIPLLFRGYENMGSWKIDLSNWLKTNNINEVVQYYEQGIELRNLTYKLSYPGEDNFLSICFQLKEMDKENNYNNIIKQADNYYNNKQYEQAKEKYTEANKLKQDEQYPKEKITEIDRSLAQAEKEVDNEQEYSQEDEKTQTDNENQSINSYNENDQSSSSYYNAQQIQKQQQAQKVIQEVNRIENQTQSNIQTINQTANNLSNLVGNIYAAQYAQREAEMARQAELERERREEERREREIEMAWNTMSDFENNFNGYFKKSLTDATGRECVYFYFGSIRKYKNEKTGSIKISNVFPVYCYPDGSWPYVSDITNKLKSKYGDVIIRGYFLTETNAERDKNNMANKARNSYFNNVNVNAYYFTYNEKPTNNNQNTDFWGKEKSDNNDTQKDFWGNEKSSNKNTNPQTDFWGNTSDTLKIKTDSLKNKSDDNFWK
jgi:hypothetical protein